jgi:hypothetical protein
VVRPACITFFDLLAFVADWLVRRAG